MKKQTLLFIFLLFFSLNNSFSGIQFGNCDLNQDNEILFTIQHNVPGTMSYSSLFTEKIEDGLPSGSPELLTCFPEKMEFFTDSSILQIRNRYGSAWYNTKDKTFSWKKKAVSIPVNSMRLTPAFVSPDGKWNCYIEKKSYISGKLILENVVSGKKAVLNPDAALNYEICPVKWADDSSVVIYERNRNIYFCNPQALLSGIEIKEEFRKIGAGSINCVNWAGNYLIYIDTDIIHKISIKELYTVGLYSSIIGKGAVIGRLPVVFSPSDDFFSVNSNLKSLVLIQSGKFFTHFKISGKKFNFMKILYSFPYTDLNSSVADIDVIWSSDDIPSIWFCRLPHLEKKFVSSIYQINSKLENLVELGVSSPPCISPDRTKCAFYSESKVSIYDSSTWQLIYEITGENIVCLVWENKDTLYIGGDKTIRRWSINETKAEPILLSSAAKAFWNNSGKITALSENGNSYLFDIKEKRWTETQELIQRENITDNTNYRVFCGKTSNAYYENALYIRSLNNKAVTKPVYPETVLKTAAKKKTALIFDAYSNIDGLSRIFYGLNLYGIKGTFFFNGEFIRRYPNEAKQIAELGNECASMFFADTDLTSGKFIVDEDFIRRGLARNEDDFFKSTGYELSLLWHAPYYKADKVIIDAGLRAGYRYISPVEKSLDITTLENAVLLGEKYYPVADVIDAYIKALKKNGGGIIPIAIGVKGSRESYLYSNLDLLINAILDEGYDIVPVRELTE